MCCQSASHDDAVPTTATVSSLRVESLKVFVNIDPVVELAADGVRLGETNLLDYAYVWVRIVQTLYAATNNS